VRISLGGREQGAGFYSPILLLTVAILTHAPRASTQALPNALADALRGTQTSAVVIDLQTGAVLASQGAERRGTPGSTLKPLLLEYALEHGIIRPEATVLCHRDLHIGARSLPCTHPASQDVFNAETALAESCNTYFAQLGRRFSGAALDQALTRSRLPHRSFADATADQRALAVLGLEGVAASPLELAQAYRQLAQSLPPDGPVARGLAGSVAYGMADPAAVAGITVLGKTGTASNPGEAWTHGWFAGILPGRLVVVVLVPRGDGGSAARLAHNFFVSLPRDQAKR
jgi:cell division protein FtsI/penicillin-binding protein 2